MNRNFIIQSNEEFILSSNMTRTNEEKLMETPKELTYDTGEALRDAVWQALEQGRLTSGVHECARLLEIDPFNTMLCVLPESTEAVSDVSSRIKHMLIEAFCTEYDIRVVKVDDADKLTKLVLGRDQAVDNAGHSGRPVAALSSMTSYGAVDCLLIQYPESHPSKEDEIVAEHYKACLFADDNNGTCVIPLPD